MCHGSRWPPPLAPVNSPGAAGAQRRGGPGDPRRGHRTADRARPWRYVDRGGGGGAAEPSTGSCSTGAIERGEIPANTDIDMLFGPAYRRLPHGQRPFTGTFVRRVVGVIMDGITGERARMT